MSFLRKQESIKASKLAFIYAADNEAPSLCGGVDNPVSETRGFHNTDTVTDTIDEIYASKLASMERSCNAWRRQAFPPP